MFGPVAWVWDRITGFVGDVATDGFQLIVGGLVAWVLDAVVWIVQGVFNFFLDAADPNVQADWFVTGDGPYATTAAIGATLLVGFVLAGITQGVLSGDVGGMLRRMALDLPVAVLGMVGLVTVTQALIRLTDEMSSWVLEGFQDDMEAFVATVESLSRLRGQVATAMVVFLLGLVAVLAGIVLVGELAVRSALVYVVVALAPLVFAAQLWPALKGTSQKLLKLLAALILSKLVIAVALAVAAAAAVGAGSGGEVTALPEPEVMAEDPGGSVTQAVGILLSAAVAFAVAAFSPLLVARLLPLAEDVMVAQGIRGMPARAAQQTLSTAYSLQMLRSYRHRGLASGRAGAGAPGGDDGTDGSDGGGGGHPGRGPGSRGGGGPRSGSGRGSSPRGRATGQPGVGAPPGNRRAAPPVGRARAASGRAGGKAAAGGGAAKAGAAAGPAGLAAAAAATAAGEAKAKVVGAASRAARSAGDQVATATGQTTGQQQAKDTSTRRSGPPPRTRAGDRPAPGPKSGSPPPSRKPSPPPGRRPKGGPSE